MRVRYIGSGRRHVPAARRVVAPGEPFEAPEEAAERLCAQRDFEPAQALDVPEGPDPLPSEPLGDSSHSADHQEG